MRGEKALQRLREMGIIYGDIKECYCRWEYWQSSNFGVLIHGIFGYDQGNYSTSLGLTPEMARVKRMESGQYFSDGVDELKPKARQHILYAGPSKTPSKTPKIESTDTGSLEPLPLFQTEGRVFQPGKILYLVRPNPQAHRESVVALCGL